MKLLVEPKFPAPPVDYLYARLGWRGRALRGSAAAPPDPHPQDRLRREYRWLYFRLAPELANKLLPLFEYGELRTLLLGLRYLAAGEEKSLNELLRQSLLQQQLQRTLLRAGQVVAGVASLEKLLAADYPEFRGLTETYLRQGPGGLEQQLLGGYLPRAIAASRSAPVAEVLGYLLDMRNLLAVYKHLRWRLPEPPVLLPGGRISVAAGQRCWRQQDLVALQQLVGKRSGLKEQFAAGGPEELLEQGLTNRCRQLAREPLQIGVLINYLWRCRQAARTLTPFSPERPAEEAG
jgi:hypothetical protein